MKVKKRTTWPVDLARRVFGRRPKFRGQMSEVGSHDSESGLGPALPDLGPLTSDLSATEPPRRGEPSKRILIVDDDAVIRKTISLKLEAAGYGVAGAVDGSEAI